MTRLLALAGALVLATSLLAIGGAAAPAAAATAAQCNGVGGGGGQGYDCAVTITNTYDVSTGIGSSTVRTILCSGAAGDATTCADSGTLTFDELTETVNQCNGTVGGGDATLYCSVTMTNTIIGAATVSAATVNQCIGSLGGGGTVPGSGCDPVQATSGATINQCNNSVNGGGGYMVCTVDSTSTANSAFSVSIEQCNGSAEGAGSLMECDVQMTTLVLPADDGEGDDSGDGNDGSDGSGSSGGSTAGGDTAGLLAETGPGQLESSLGLFSLVLILTGGMLIAARTRAKTVLQE